MSDTPTQIPPPIIGMTVPTYLFEILLMGSYVLCTQQPCSLMAILAEINLHGKNAIMSSYFFWNICQISSKHIIICTSLGFWGFSCRDSWNISCINHGFSPMILKMSPGLTTVFWGIKNFWEIILRDKPTARSMCPFLAYWQVVVLFFLQLMDSNNLPD